jgi:NAD(P) transhydrogenase
MERFWVSSLLLLCALAVISPHRVVSFQVHRREALFRNSATVSPISSTQTIPRKVTRPIQLKAKAAEGDNDDPAAPDHPYDYDLAIIGAGPVGVQAAILAAGTAKKKVVLIDAPRASGQLMNEETNEDLSLGGPTGLFSKALRDAGKRIKVPTLRGMGLREDSIWNEITSSCVELASFNARDIKRQLEYAGVTYIDGYAKFKGYSGSHHLIVSHDDETPATTISTDKVLIATGSRPFQPTNIPFDGIRIFDSDSINGLNFLPKSVVITGR